MAIRSLHQFFPEPGDKFFRGQALVTFGKNPAARSLRSDAALVEFLDLAILLHQFSVVCLDVLDHRVELVAREARHGLLDKVEVVAPVQVVEDIHDSQPVPFDLRAAALLDDPNLLRVHVMALGQ